MPEPDLTAELDAAEDIVTGRAETVTIGPLVLEKCAATYACPHYPHMCSCPHPWWRHHHWAAEVP